eukprot:2970451-Prymnesium_polylepis.1
MRRLVRPDLKAKSAQPAFNYECPLCRQVCGIQLHHLCVLMKGTWTKYNECMKEATARLARSSA